MVDSLVPELELCAWDGQLGGVQDDRPVKGSLCAAEGKRPRIIAAAAGPLLPDGSTRRKRLYIVEPLGMWLNDRQAVPTSSGMKAPPEELEPPSNAAVDDPGTVNPTQNPAMSPSGSPALADAFAANARAATYSPGNQAQSSQDIAFPNMAMPAHQVPVPKVQVLVPKLQQDGRSPRRPQQQQQQQQQKHHQQSRTPPPPAPPLPPQQQHQYQPHQDELPTAPPQPPPQQLLLLQQSQALGALGLTQDSAFPGPVRRMAASPAVGFAPHQPLASTVQARFQPYISRSPAGSPITAPTGLPLLGNGLHRIPIACDNDAPCGDALFKALQLQGTPRGHDDGVCPQLLQMHSQPQQQQQDPPLLSSTASAGAAETLWQTWMREDEMLVEGVGSGGIGRRGRGAGVGVDAVQAGASTLMPLEGAAAAALQPYLSQVAGQVAASPTVHPLSNDELPPPSSTAAGPLQFFGLQQLQQHLLLQQQQQQQVRQHLQHTGLQRSMSAAAAVWSNGCAEVWAAAFGEPAPLQTVLPRMTQTADGGAAGGRRRLGGAVAALSRAGPLEPPF